MRFVTALALILLAAPLAAAETGTASPDEVRPEVSSPVVGLADAPTAPEMILTQVTIPESASASSETVIVQDMPSRGSFWWLVGVIVVAGIILAVVL